MILGAVGLYDVKCARDETSWQLGFGKRPALRDDILIDGYLYKVIEVKGSTIYVANLRRRVTVPLGGK